MFGEPWRFKPKFLVGFVFVDGLESLDFGIGLLQFGQELLFLLLGEFGVQVVVGAAHPQNVGVEVHPALQVAQLAELRHFELLGEIDLLGSFLEGGVEPVGHDFAVVGDAHQLALEQMPLFAREDRVGFDFLFEVATEDVLDESGYFELLGGDERKLVPLLRRHILCDPEGVVVGALPVLLHAFADDGFFFFFADALDDEVVVGLCEDFAPEPNLGCVVLLGLG